MTQNPFSDPNYGADAPTDASSKSNPFADPEYGKKPQRTWGEAIKDTGAQLAEGVNTTLGAIPSVVAPQSKAAGFFRDNAEHWRDQQSDVLKGRIAASDQRIQEAGKDGVMSQIGTAASEYWNDPAQAARLVATNLPSMAATLGTGAAAGLAAKGVAAARGLDAANKAALAAKYGTTTGAATNAALNAGGARGEAFEDLQKAAIAQGMTPEQAEQAGVSGSILPGVVGGVAGTVSGKIGLEKALLGQATTGAAMRKAGGAFGAELAGEQIEELAPKVATNYQVGQLDAARGLTDDLGRTMVETAIGSGPGAVVAGGAAGMRTGELPPVDLGPVDPTTSPGAADPNAPVPPPVAGPTLALPAPERGVIHVGPDGTARTPAYQAPGYVGDVTDVEPRAVNPVREQVAAAAEQGGALSSAALTAIDTGLSDAMQPAPEQAPPQISLEEADARDRAAYEQFFANLDAEPVVGRYVENDDDIPDFDAASNVTDEEFLRSLDPTITDQEIQDAIATTRQPSSPQGSAAGNAGPQAYEPAGPREGAGEGAASQTGQVNAGAIQQAAPDAPVPGVGGQVGADGAGSAAAAVFGASGAGGAGTGAATGSGAGATEVGSARAGGRGDSNQALSAPTNLRDALERVRQQKQEAANAQAAQAPVPAAAPVPGPAAAPAVEAAGVKPAGQRQLSADEQAAQDREEARAKELSLPPVLSARLQEAHKAHGRGVKRSVVERSIANEKANNTGTPKAKRERADRIARLEADLALFDEAAAMPPKEAAGPASIPATIGANSEPTPPQAIQAGTQPAQAAAAPAAGPAPTNTAAPAPAGAPEVRALSNGTPTANNGAQAAPAPGPQGKAQTPDQIRRARLEREISTGKTNNGGVIASLRPSAIEKRKQELDAMGERGRILDAQGKAPRATAEQLTGAQERWQRMTTAERQAVAARTDVKPILRKNLHGAKWENLNVDVQRKLQAAMEPQAVPALATGPVRVGRDNTPLGEGGKPFKTRKAAGDAKKLQPMMRVVTVPGGYALAEKTPAQLAAEERASRRLRNPNTSARGEPIPAHAFIAAAGGLNRVAASDMGVDGNPRIGNRTLFAGQGRGLSMDQATQMLIQDGYLSEGATINDALSLIKTSLTRPQYNADGIERIAQAEADAQFEDYLAAQEEAAADGDTDPFGMADEFTAEELDEVGYTDADPALQAEVSALIAQAEAMDIDTFAILEDIARTYANATQDQYNAAARDALAQAIARSNQDGGSAAAQTAPAAESAADQGLDPTPALELASQTPAEAAAQQEAQEQAAKAEAARQRAADAQAARDEERKRIAQASVRAADRFELGQDPLDSLTGQGSIFDAPAPSAPTAASDDEGRERFTLSIEMFGDVPYRASKPVDAGSGEVVSSRVITTKTKLTAANAQSLGLPKDKGTVYAWRVSVIRRADGAAHSVIEAMATDNGRSPDGEVLAHFKEVENPEAMERIAPAIVKAAMADWQAAQSQQAPAATEPVAQPITRADVAAAHQQAATLIAERIDAMTAGEVNKIAKQFLPTMGKKATASKERNKAAMTDSAINLEAAAAEVGATLPADVRRVLQADMEGAVADGFVEQGDAPMFSRTKAITPAQRAENFARWSDNAPLISSEQAEVYDFKTGQKIVVEAFHGSARPDRIGGVFDPKRATSGPMAYFTSSPELASSYAKGKEDTSLADDDQSYANWFKFKPPGARSAVSIDRAWHFLTPEVQARIRKLAPRIAMDDTGENIVIDPDNTDGLGNYGWELQQARGNPLAALVESWLTSGTLFNEETQFMDVLRMAGFPVAGVEMDFPNAAYPGVFKTYVSMKNPLVVGDMPTDVRAALEQAAKADRSRAKPGADMWDKRSHTLRDWWAKFTDPDPSTATYAWTSIPDKVTDILKAHGYDGIVDWSGKGGGHQSPVYIPFGPTQVKSVFNRGTFDPTKKDISFGRGANAAIGTPAATIRAAITKAYGKLLGQLESKGLVTLTQTEDEAIEAAAQARAAKTGQSVEQARSTLRASVKNSVTDPDIRRSAALSGVTFSDDVEASYAGQTNHTLTAKSKNGVVGVLEYVVYEGVPSISMVTVSKENRRQGVGRALVQELQSKFQDIEIEWGMLTEDGAALRNSLQFEERPNIDVQRKQHQLEIAVVERSQLEAEANKRRDSDGYSAWIQTVSERWNELHDEIDELESDLAAAGPSVRRIVVASETQQSPASIDIKRSANGSIQGFFDPQTGQSFLVADNLTAQAAPGVLMHEVGIHMAADGSMKALFNRAAMMLKLQRGNPFMKAVQDRMDAAGETSGEEAAAYIAEAYENDRANAPASVQRWLADLLAAVKAWMFKKGIMGADRLTVADIAAVARANARSMARDGGATGGQGFGTAFSRAKGKPNKDSEYLAAVESSDMETAQRMVDQAARDAGYISGNDYRMAHSAPSSEMDTSLVNLREEGLVPADYWTKPQWYQSTPEEMDSWRKVTDAFRRLDAKTKPGGAPYPVAMTVYRAVPKDVKDGSIRNGDWVTPSLEYAKMEGESIPGGYRVISQQALIRNLYWDGNSIAELGYDDGKGYAYKNTKNNRKLMDAVTRDDDGNIIPLSQRFNARSDDVRFSRVQPTIPADSAERNAATELLVDGLIANWKKAPPIIVARNMQDAQVPQEVRDYDALLKSQGATGEARGFIYKGKVYLLSDQLKGPQQIAEVLFHEVLGHYGLHGAFGESLTPILQQIGTMRRRDVVAKAREYGLFDKDALGGLDKKAASDAQIWAAMSPKDRLSAAEEVLAEMAQTQPTIGFVQRAIAAIRNWLRANVPGFKSLALTDNDIIQAYILPARGYVTSSRETGAQSLERAMRDAGFSRAPTGDQTQTEAFKRWFGDSKAVDAEGNPLVLYHGTNVGINEFKPAKGLRSAGGLFESSATSPFKFFSPDKEEAQSYANAKGGHRLFSVYLRMERPLDSTTPDGLARMHRLFGSLDDTELSDWADSAVDLLDGIDELRATTPAEKSYFIKRDAKGRVIGQRATEREGYILEKYTAEDHAAEIERDLAQLIVEYEALLSAVPSSDAPLSVWAALDEPDSGDRLRAAGFDGLVFHENDGKKTFAVLDSTQIKSAVGNNGDFDPANPDIRFSRTTDAAKAVGDTLKSITVSNVKQRAGFKLTDYLGIGLQALGRRQIVDIYGDLAPLAEYNRLVQQMEADKNEGGAEADQLVTRWAKLDDESKLADLMHDATLAQIDPAKPYVGGDDKAKYAMLAGRFNALSQEAKQVYTDTRDAYQAHHAKVRGAIKERIERSEIKGERKAALLKQMDDEFFKAVKGVYFPLARFGQYAVTVKGPDGEVESVSRAETKAEAEALRNNLLTAFPRDKGFTVGRVMLSKDFIADRDAVGRGFMTELYQVLDKQDMDATQRAELEDTLGQLYLSSLPDLSWAKHGIHRKGTPGFSQDARRAFAQNMFHGARYLAKLRYSDLMQDELGAMQKHVDDWREVEDFDQNSAQRVVDEMNHRHESLMNPKSNALSTALTSFGFIFHLGLSPASAMVNLSQTALVAYPIMGAKWGFGKASAALLKASAEAAKGKNDITASLNADERAAYDEAVRAGTIDVTMAHDLAGIAQGEDAGVMWKIRPVMRWASFLFHHAERFNRQVTFVAAYRLAREAGADHKAAFEQATKATYDGHFDYGAANRPRIMQGNVAKVLLLFKQYGQNMVYTLSRNAYQSIKGTDAEKAEARKALAGLLTSHAMAAGVLGLPMVTTLLAAASMIGGDDDEPWDAKVALQNLLADTFGQKPAEVLAHGLSRLTPWDISGRVGLDKLIFPDVQEGLEGQRLAESAMAAALGPVAGIGVNMLKGAQHMSEGRYALGLEAMMPAVLRGPVKAIRYANEGVQDKSGISILDEVGPAAVAGQALGFSPSQARNAQEGKSAVMAHDRALSERRQELLTRAARASMAKDAEALDDARKEIARFNEKNPGRRINPNHIMQSVRNRQKRIDQAEGGVYLPKNRRDAIQAGRFANAD